MNSFSFHQHISDFTSLPIQELLLGPVVVIRECNMLGETLDSPTNLLTGKDTPDELVILASVVAHSS
jgi:hypothetical protein